MNNASKRHIHPFMHLLLRILLVAFNLGFWLALACWGIPAGFTSTVNSMLYTPFVLAKMGLLIAACVLMLVGLLGTTLTDGPNRSRKKLFDFCASYGCASAILICFFSAL